MKITKYHPPNPKYMWIFLIFLIFLTSTGKHEYDFNYGVILTTEIEYSIVDTVDTPFFLEEATLKQSKQRYTKDYLIPKMYLEHLWLNKTNEKTLSTVEILKFKKQHEEVVSNQSKKYNIPTDIIMAKLIYHSECGNSEPCKRYNNYFDLRNETKTKYLIYDTKWESINNHNEILSSFYNSNVKPTTDDWLNWSFDMLDKDESERSKYISQLKLIISIIN